MKHNSKITALIFMIMTTFFVTTWYGCQKNNDFVNTTTATENLTAKQVQQNAINGINLQNGRNVGAAVVYPVNEAPKQLYFKNNSSNNFTDYYSIKSTNDNLLCTRTCNTTTFPGDLNLVYKLEYIQRNFGCESSIQSSMFVKWTISVPFTPLSTFSGNNSVGTVNITSPGGSILSLTSPTIDNYPNDNSTSIKNLGIDPNCSVNTIYEINYTVTGVPNTYFGTGMQLNTSLTLYNDCALLGNVIVTGNTAPSPKFLLAHEPCRRIDKVWVNPNTGPGGTATAIGNYTICTPPSGFLVIDLHQFEYRQVTSTTSFLWDDQSSTSLPGINISTGAPSNTINPSSGQTLYLPGMTNGSGKWLVRYRNIKTGTCDQIPGTGSNWNAIYWATELWPL